ncbi:4-oxalocrotonate tautomerase DmpI [Staphylococcus durrellii]|uniref:4-oxalocrotonate tautomerase DmpI n=1 Tax=Staphylococcus durrellii TaxID=2781773 RepID=UPI00189F265F|nr:4-oxalocrotonate tautomerase DmpI [Staphylococcus durrellii]MBF7018182.1 tautomerase family protein [Staphylococcus durrellii]
MPILKLETLDLTKDQKKQLVEELTETASRITGIPQEGYYVILKENNLDNVGSGGKLLSERT